MLTSKKLRGLCAARLGPPDVTEAMASDHFVGLGEDTSIAAHAPATIELPFALRGARLQARGEAGIANQAWRSGNHHFLPSCAPFKPDLSTLAIDTQA